MQVLVSVSLTLTLAALSASAADFWDKKPFAEWSASEVQKMLNNSPWARPALLPRETLSRELQDAEARARVKPACGSCAVSGSTPSIEPVRSPELQEPLTVVVRWLSALPVKQALARLRFGDEAANSTAVAEMLAQPEERYVVGIGWLPEAALPAGSDEIKAAAALETRNAPPIPAREVTIRRDGAMVNLLLYFPKSGEAIQPISLNDREVTVALKFASLSIKRKFKLSDMVYQGDLEL